MKFLTVTLVVLLCTATAVAQTMPAAPAEPHRLAAFEQLNTYLKLTDPQVDQIKALETTQRTSLKPIFEDMAKIRTDLQTALNKQPVDSARVTELRTELQSKRSEIQNQRSQMRTQIQAILTAQQQAQLQQLEEALKLQVPARQAAMLDLIPAPSGSWGMHNRMAAARFMNRRNQEWGWTENRAMNAPKSNP